MNEAKRHVVAIAGLGVVGTGVASILEAGRESIARRTGVEIVLARAAEKDAARAAEAGVSPEKVIGDAGDLIEDPSIETVVEVIGGTGYAREFILGALSAGKNVVTANKALLAEHGTEIFKAALENGVVVGFEASVAGGVPIIRTLREAYAGDNIRRIAGILNGTCNYILTRMSREGIGFREALAEAKAKGYAEADPTLDISGTDSAHKIVILARLAFGGDFDLDKVYCEGISDLETIDIEYASQLGYRVKLLALAKKGGGEVGLRVHPCLVKDSHPLAYVDGVFNSVYVEGEYAGETMLYGQGAGRWPTASAVVADLIDVATGRAGTLSFEQPLAHLSIKPMSRMMARYYIRFQAIDRPGVLAGIAGVLGAEGISIAQAIQKGRREGQSVPVVVITHEAAEGAVQEALRQIEGLDIVTGKSVLLREEE